MVNFGWWSIMFFFQTYSLPMCFLVGSELWFFSKLIHHLCSVWMVRNCSFFFWNLDLFFAKNSQIFIANNWKVITNNLIFYFPDPVFKKRPIKEDLAFVEGGGSPHTNQDPTLHTDMQSIYVPFQRMAPGMLTQTPRFQAPDLTYRIFWVGHVSTLRPLRHLPYLGLQSLCLRHARHTWA